MKGMGRLLFSAGAWLFVACGTMEPKQAWERPRTESTESEAKKEEPPPTTVEASPPKEPSHEDVCRKMWDHIANDAKDKSKKGKTKVPTDKDRSDFLQDCFKSGADDKKSNPEKYACRRKCIMESEALPQVEDCMKACK
jgi:hypothetical protein